MALLALVAIATVGMCIWGIVVSVDNTDSQITNFWELVDNVDEKVSLIQQHQYDFIFQISLVVLRFRVS